MSPSPEEPSLAEIRTLVRRALDGHADASRALYRLHVATVFRVVRSWCASEADAEELVQETFTRAFASLGRFEPRPGKPFLGWLLAIALNAARSRHRKDRAHQAFEDTEHHAAVAPSTTAEDALLAAERRRELLEALEGLDERERTVVSLRYAAEWSAAEVAELLGLEEAHVRKICERARKHLLERLAPRLSDDSSAVLGSHR